MQVLVHACPRIQQRMCWICAPLENLRPELPFTPTRTASRDPFRSATAHCRFLCSSNDGDRPCGRYRLGFAVCSVWRSLRRAGSVHARGVRGDEGFRVAATRFRRRHLHIRFLTNQPWGGSLPRFLLRAPTVPPLGAGGGILAVRHQRSKPAQVASRGGRDSPGDGSVHRRSADRSGRRSTVGDRRRSDGQRAVALLLGFLGTTSYDVGVSQATAALAVASLLLLWKRPALAGVTAGFATMTMLRAAPLALTLVAVAFLYDVGWPYAVLWGSSPR